MKNRSNISETANHGTLVRHSWVEILGSVLDAYLYGQILYWFTPDKNNNQKVRVFKDGNYWVAKTYLDWSNELSIPETTIKNLLFRLIKLNVIVKEIYKFNGSPCVHVRINWEVHQSLEETWFAEKYPEDYKNISDAKNQQEEVVPAKAAAQTAAKPKTEITFSDDEFNKFLAIWNAHRGELAEAQTLTTVRKTKIQKYFKDYGVDKTLEMLEKATKVVAKDDWWLGKGNSKKKYGLDSLFYEDKIVTKAESYAEVKEVKSYAQLQSEMLY